MKKLIDPFLSLSFFFLFYEEIDRKKIPLVQDFHIAVRILECLKSRLKYDIFMGLYPVLCKS